MMLPALLFASHVLLVGVGYVLLVKHPKATLFPSREQVGSGEPVRYRSLVAVALVWLFEVCVQGVLGVGVSVGLWLSPKVVLGVPCGCVSHCMQALAGAWNVSCWRYRYG